MLMHFLTVKGIDGGCKSPRGITLSDLIVASCVRQTPAYILNSERLLLIKENMVFFIY